MVQASQIKPNARVVCSKDGQFGIVDHMEGVATIKLTRDTKGQHHYIPLSWVTKVDDKVHVDRPGEQAMREWSTTPPVPASAPAAAPAATATSPKS
jgi:hypothetical protein